MCDDEIHQGQAPHPPLSRRAFAAAAAGLSAAAFSPRADAEASVVERDVEVKTLDGVADAALFHPAGGRWPAVLIWTDILGLRPVFREMGRRLAAQGYTVLVPNPFYRSRRAPVVDDAFDFNKPDDRAKVFALAALLTPETARRDASAFTGFLDAQPQTNIAVRSGVQGYCMGGPLAFRTAAANPSRIGAVGAFHGGGLVTKGLDSPHLLIPLMSARVYCAIAANDDAREPDAKDVLKTAFNAASVPARIEVYAGANHGWCVKGGAAYNEASAERAWSELLTLYTSALT